MPGRDVTVFSDGDVGLQGIVLSATRQSVTHILDWFHLSMWLRHIEQAWEGLRHVGDLNIYRQRLPDRDELDLGPFAGREREGYLVRARLLRHRDA